MKSANASFGGAPPAPHDRAGRSSQSQTYPSPRAPGDRERTTPQKGTRELGGWARCEERASAPPPAPERRPQASAQPDEPRTGVVRRLALASGERKSGLIARSALRTEHPREPSARRSGQERAASSSGDWRCLEWSQPAKERRPRLDSKVTIVQLSHGGDLLRHNGPDAWVPEAGDFMRRMAGLVARGLGFERCRSVCLKSATGVLTVAEAGDKVVAVSGPVRSMANVLRREGLE